MERDNTYLLGNKHAAGRGPNGTSFKKGMTPWNKGVSVHLSPGTEFKKGRPPLNSLPVGSVTTRSHKRDGKRRWVKISEPNKWEMHAVWVWSQRYGAVIPGDIIHHLDGDRLNDVIGNLIAIPRNDHPIFHSRWGLKPMDARQIEWYIGRYSGRQEVLPFDAPQQPIHEQSSLNLETK